MLNSNNLINQHIIESSNVGTWVWNVQTGEVDFNERWAGIIGYSLIELGALCINTWIEYSHPEDLQKSNKILEQHFKGVLEHLESEVSKKHNDVHWVWVEDEGKVIE